MTTSRIREQVEGEVIAYYDCQSGARITRAFGGVQRITDLWLLYDLLTALRTITANRYRHRKDETPARRDAIERMRTALAEAKDALAALAEAGRLLARLTDQETDQ